MCFVLQQGALVHMIYLGMCSKLFGLRPSQVHQQHVSRHGAEFICFMLALEMHPCSDSMILNAFMPRLHPAVHNHM